jgi:hypothetical protein
MDERPARRYPASAFPEIRGVRLTPLGATAALVNLSASGILVECGSRAVADTAMTVHFDGSFSPASIESRVVRCEVAGIAPDGSLRYHIGLAFSGRITLPVAAQDEVAECAAAPSAPLVAAAAVAAEGSPVLRNRW